MDLGDTPLPGGCREATEPYPHPKIIKRKESMKILSTEEKIAILDRKIKVLLGSKIIEKYNEYRGWVEVFDESDFLDDDLKFRIIN